MMKKKWKPSHLYLAIVLLFIYLPILFVVVYSFNESKSTAVWSGFTLQWYQNLAADDDLLEALGNSLLLGLLSCLSSAVIGTLGAVGLARSRLRSKGLITYVARLPMMIPEIILGMVFMAFFSLLHLPFGMLTLVIAHTAFCIPYILMMVQTRLAGLDPSLEEAARDLGAGSMRTFRDILLPLLMPGVLSGALLAFAMSLDDVVISIFVTGPRVSTLPIKIYTQMKFGVTPEINALCTLMLVITLLVVLLYWIITKVIGRRRTQ